MQYLLNHIVHFFIREVSLYQEKISFLARENCIKDATLN